MSLRWPPPGGDERTLGTGRLLASNSFQCWHFSCRSNCWTHSSGGPTQGTLDKNASEQNSLLQKITARMSNSLPPSFVPNKQAAPWLSPIDLGSLGFEQSAALENSALAPSQHRARAQECVYWP